MLQVEMEFLNYNVCKINDWNTKNDGNLPKPGFGKEKSVMLQVEMEFLNNYICKIIDWNTKNGGSLPKPGSLCENDLRKSNVSMKNKI
nr:hypothetical protein [Ignavibacteria bacterium]